MTPLAWLLLATNLLTIVALGVVCYQRDKARDAPAGRPLWQDEL